MKILNKAVTEGAPKGLISWSWIYIIAKDPWSQDKGRRRLQAREATAHGNTIHITALINPSCQPERLVGISALEALQFTLCYCISGFLACQSSSRNRLPVLHMEREAVCPTHSRAQTSKTISCCLPSKSSFGIIPGGTGAWGWRFCIRSELPSILQVIFSLADLVCASR